MMEIVLEDTFANRAKNFIERHKVAIAVGATAAVTLWIHRIALKQHEEFLAEHDLLDEFYTPEDEF
jgi:hypothetical protein